MYLPKVLWIKISHFLETKDLLSMMLVNKYFNSFIGKDNFITECRKGELFIIYSNLLKHLRWLACRKQLTARYAFIIDPLSPLLDVYYQNIKDNKVKRRLAITAMRNKKIYTEMRHHYYETEYAKQAIAENIDWYEFKGKPLNEYLLAISKHTSPDIYDKAFGFGFDRFKAFCYATWRGNYALMDHLAAPSARAFEIAIKVGGDALQWFQDQKSFTLPDKPKVKAVQVKPTHYNYHSQYDFIKAILSECSYEIFNKFVAVQGVPDPIKKIIESNYMKY